MSVDSVVRFDLYIESRLREWANWIIDIKLGNIGHPKESLISKIMLLGILSSTNNKQSIPLVSHDSAEIVGYWLMRMSQYYPRYTEAIFVYYLNPNYSLRLMANELKISISTLKARVKDGKVWLSGLLTAYSDDLC